MTASVAPSPAKNPDRPADIAGRYEMTAEASALLSSAETPSMFLEKCLEKRLFVDAAEFLSYWLPKKQAIWWGVLSYWWQNRKKLSPEASGILDAVVRWLQEPTDELRREIRAAGYRLDRVMPEAILCESVFWSEGSISEPQFEHVDPPATMTNFQVFILLRTLANAQPEETRDFCWRQLLHIGLEIRQDKNHWIVEE